MDCFVGASTGALKTISFKDGVFNNLNVVSSLKPEDDEITSMCWADEHETQLLVAQMNKELKLYDTVGGKGKALLHLKKGTGAVRGIHRTKSDHIVSAIESGELCISTTGGEVVREMDAGNNLRVMVANRERDEVYATGGKENTLKVWDIEKGEKTFIAKNVKSDNLQLRVPVWEADIRFIPQSENIATVTGKHQIRLYDPRAQRRPVNEIEWLEEPLTTMSLCGREMHVIVGNSRGEMALFDLRNKMKIVCKYKGCAGSVSGIDAHSSADYVASCSLDRYVRLHEVTSKKLLKKVYCKARLNRILLRDKLSILKNEESIKEEYEEDWSKIKVNDNVSDDSESDSRNTDEAEDTWYDDNSDETQSYLKRKGEEVNTVTSKIHKLRKMKRKMEDECRVAASTSKKSRMLILKRRSESDDQIIDCIPAKRQSKVETK